MPVVVPSWRSAGVRSWPAGEAAEQLAGGDRAGRRRSSRTRAGTPGARRARCRSGSGRPTASRCCWRSGCRRRTRPRRRRVVAEDAVRAGLVLGPGQHHERAGSAGTSSPVPGLPSGPSVISGSSALQRDEDGAAALDGLVDAVVEELAEEREQRVVRRREADVGGDVRDEQGLVRRHAAGGDADDRRMRRRVRVGGARVHARGCPGCAPGTPAAATRPGWSRSGRRSGC